MKKIIVPKELGKFFENKIGESTKIFNVINNLIMDYNTHKFEYQTMVFISENMNDIIEVIRGEREYEVEKEKFYALIKGWEKIKGTPHWCYNEEQDEFTIDYCSNYPGDDVMMTIDRWEELGINDSNSCFSPTLDLK